MKPEIEVSSVEKLARIPAAPGPVLANSAKRTWSVFGVAVDQMDHPAGLMCEPRVELLNTTLELCMDVSKMILT